MLNGPFHKENTMKIKLKVKRLSDGATWVESYEEDMAPEEVQEWAEGLLAWFNATLRPGESPRDLIGIIIEDEDNSNLHKWTKRSDGQSVMFRGRVADLMYCEKCGITGKRFGLSQHVVIDSKFRAKKYQQCGWQQKGD